MLTFDRSTEVRQKQQRSIHSVAAAATNWSYNEAVMLPLTRVPLFLVCLSNALQLTLTLPVDGAASHKDELVLVEEAMHYVDFDASSTATLITLDGAVVTDGEGQAVHHRRNPDNESMMDTSAAAADDLIFLTVKMPVHSQQQQHDAQHHSIHEIDLLTVEDLSASCSSSCESHGGGAEDVDEGDGAIPREIELQADDLSPPSSARRSIDMRDFVALIPADEVKAIVANYYRNDPEVQRAYAYLSGRAFAQLKQRVIAVPEMSAFLRYLNASGLDVVGFFHTLTNLTSKPAESVVQQNPAEPWEGRPLNASRSDVLPYNGNFENTSQAAAEPTTIAIPETAKTTMQSTEDATLDTATATTTTMVTTTTTTTTTITTTTTTENAAEEGLNGLHGLVDSILDVLPQDQILTTFFDKLEANEQFSKLVDNVGSPEFAEILHNMESSAELRNLIVTLHNNGIYITRIVDSLKAYFFLGTF